MKKIELSKIIVENNLIRYEVKQEKGLDLLQEEIVKLFIRFHGNENFNIALNELPQSILALPISLYLLPITYFYNVELVLPEMDKTLYEKLPEIYAAYSKIYGPFKNEWRGKLTVGKIVENSNYGNAKYDKVVFFSGGVDAVSAGINNPGKKTLLVSIPDIESQAKNEGPLRKEKFSLIKRFSKVVDSDWLLISNNFNAACFNDGEINKTLRERLKLNSDAFNFDGWFGIKYLANMCCVAPIAYATGVEKLVMGSTFERLEDKFSVNYDGANPELSDSIAFAGTRFAEQDEIYTLRSKKTKNIVDWCNARGKKTKLWTCFSDRSTQCGICTKCLRTQLNILCANENPKEWGFDNFSEKTFARQVCSYRYLERNACWPWDIFNSIDENITYSYCNDLLHWMKRLGYKEYLRRAKLRSRVVFVIRCLISIHKYPRYLKKVFQKLV